MKKVFALLLAACILLSFTGCNALDYKAAVDLYNDGQYAQARDAFLALGEYADSAAMAKLSSQKADYEKAEQLYGAGDYRLALPLYQGLEMYMDSPVKSILCQYQIGLGCIESGAYEEALTWLEPLGTYEDCREQVLRAKWLWLYQTVQAGGILETKVSDSTVSFIANEDGTLTLRYYKQAYLLGMPQESELSMILQQGVRESSYRAMYLSSSTSKIQEEIAGILDAAQFSASYRLPVSSFSQVNVDPEGTQTTSEDPADALMMQVTLMEAQNALAEGLPLLLQLSEVPITAAEFGFAAL